MLNLVKSKQTMYGLEGYNNVIEKVIKDLNACSYYFDIKLILTEALSNAFEHGNKSDKSKPIELFYDFDGKHLNFRITHSVTKVKNLAIPESISDDNLLDEHGRGLFLIKNIADKVELKDNSLIIVKNIINTSTT